MDNQYRNIETDANSQEITQKIGENGDKILENYFDDIGLARRINQELTKLINRLKNRGMDINKILNEYRIDVLLNTKASKEQATAIVTDFFKSFGIDVSKLVEKGKYQNESGQNISLFFSKDVKRNEATSPTFAKEDVQAYVKETGTLADVYSLVHEISHTLYVQNNFSEARMILGEIIPQCMERMLDEYLLEHMENKEQEFDFSMIKEDISKRRISTAIDRFRLASRIANGQYRFASEKAELSRYMLAQIYATQLTKMDKSIQKQRILDFIEAIKNNNIQKANDIFEIKINKENAMERDKYINNCIFQLQQDIQNFAKKEMEQEK